MYDEANRRLRHREASCPLYVKKENPLQVYIVSFYNKSFKFIHGRDILGTSVTPMPVCFVVLSD